MDEPVTIHADSVRMEPVASLSEHPDNPRAGDLGALIEVIKTNGYIVPVIAQKSTRRVIDGNHRLKAAVALGMEQVPVVWVDIDDDRALRHLLAANRLNDLAGYEDQALADLLTDLAQTSGLDGTGFDGDFLDQLLADLALADPPKGDDDPGPTEPPAEPVTKPGDLWVLGEHRLLCGDATQPGDYAVVLVDDEAALGLTDPPYGVGIEYASVDDDREKIGRLIDAYLPVLRQACPRVLITCGHRLMWRYPAPSWVLAWVEPAGTGMSPWGFTCTNPVLAYGSDPYLAAGRGSRPDTFFGTGEGASHDAHPVAKPLGVWQWLMERGSIDRGDVVLDPFAGSGTTLVAAENLGRKARLIEIDPGYCDVICKRWQGLTGEQPTRDGTPHDFLAEPSTPLLARAFRAVAS